MLGEVCERHGQLNAKNLHISAVIRKLSPIFFFHAPLYQNMAEDHTYKGVGECHPYREFEGMQPSR